MTYDREKADQLLSTIPGLATYCLGLLLGIRKGERQHRRHQDCISLRSDQLSQLTQHYGGLEHVASTLGLRVVHDEYSHSHGRRDSNYTRAWSVDPLALAHWTDLLEQVHQCFKLRRQKRKSNRRLPVVVRTGRTALDLQARIQSLRGSRTPADAIQLLELLAVQAVAYTGPDGYLQLDETYWRHTPRGRWFLEGTGLQNVSKRTREWFLAGCGYWDHDAQNAHLTLLSQELERLGAALSHFPTLTANVQDPVAFRESLAESLGVSVKLAKTCILSTCYGATLAVRQPRILAQAVQPLRTLEAVYGQLPAGSKARIDEQGPAGWGPLHALERELRTAVGYLRTTPLWLAMEAQPTVYGTKSSQLLAHYLQALESRVLETCMQYMDNNGIGMVAAMHDGFIATSRLNTQDLSNWVFSQTGYRLTFTSKAIQ